MWSVFSRLMLRRVSIDDPRLHFDMALLIVGEMGSVAQMFSNVCRNA